MKTYYKGNLVLISGLLDNEVKIGYSEYTCFSPTDEWLFIKNNRVLKKYLDEVSYYLNSNYRPVESKFYDNFDVFKNPNFKFSYSKDFKIVPICYEVITCEDGRRYGMELYTKHIFPLVFSSDFKPEYIYIKNTNGYVYICLKPNFSHPSLSKLECLVFDEAVADKNEVDEYLNMFSNGMFKKRKKAIFMREITEFYNKNVFNREIKPVEAKKIVRVGQARETSLMEDIELMLQKVKRIDIDNYQKYLAEYERLLSPDKSPVNPLCVASLASLLGRIEASLFFIKNGSDDIALYLEQLKIEYLEKFLLKKDEKTKISLDDLDKINELFLRTKDEYDLVKQRKIIRNISFIYLLEVKENIDKIDIERLKISYFADNIKSIVLSINALCELGFIKKDLIIDLNTDLSVDSVLEIIKRIEFNEFNKGKVKEMLKLKV